MEEVTDDIIHFVSDYCGYDYSEVAQWSDETIIKNYYSIIKELKEEE